MATQDGLSLYHEDNAGKETGSIACFQCGVCCSGRRVRVSLVEARRICDGLGLNWYVFLSNYTGPERLGDGSYFLRQQDGACIFLKNTDVAYRRICIVHMFKPSACREWNPSLFRRDCQQGLARYWHLTVDGGGRLCGSGEDLRRFRLYLDSIMAGEGLGLQGVSSGDAGGCVANQMRV